MKSTITSILMLTLFLFQHTVADEDIHFSMSTWVSQGQTKWRHDDSFPGSRVGVPTSELDYQNVDSNIVEFNMRYKLPGGHVFKLAVGEGSIDSGTLVDDDYLSASGATFYGASQSGNHRYSRTHSDINGSGLSYFNGEFSPQDFFVKNRVLDLRFSFALHYWEEEYTASGLRQIECTTTFLCNPAGFSGFSGVTVITNRVEWTGYGIAVANKINIGRNALFTIDITYYPLLMLNNEDTHHLRGDLAQDPSISMTGNGTGYDLSAGFRYQVDDSFAAHIGYRLWQRWVKNQSITFHEADGSSSSADLMEFKTRREGLVSGFEFKF